MTVTIRPPNMREITIPIRTEVLEGLAAIPARCETYRTFHVESTKFPCIIEPQEIENDVFVATTVAYQPNTVVRVLNINEDIKLVSTKTLKTVSLDSYDIFRIRNNHNNINEQRLNILRNLLEKRIPKHAIADLMPLCMEFNDIFHIPGDKATVNNFYEQKLSVKDDIPVYIKNYRLPQSQKEEIQAQVRKLLEDDLIEMSTSNYNSPLILVPKKSVDGQPKWRMCIDYRQLNKKLLHDRFPMPRIDEILDGLGKAKYFSVLDLQAGYHQIPLARESRKITSFSTDRGYFQWKVLPFGINVAPASFSRMMAIAFASLRVEEAFSYMDDLIVIGVSERNHLNNLKRVFETCRKYNLKLNSEKCDFFKHEVLFLGHKCTADGLLPDPAKLAAVKNYPTPKNQEETKRFVAFANFYRRFIRNFSDIAVPLNKMTQKRVKFNWSDECEKAFQTLKNRLMSPPILVYPDYDKEFRVTVDASQFACGAVLSQRHGDSDRPVSFISRTFKKGELNKHITEKELLAIHFAIKTFKPYLWGRYFVVFSDHKPLIYLYALKEPTSRLTRIRLDLEEYNFMIEHIKGKDNIVADALSRVNISNFKDLDEQGNAWLKSKVQESESEAKDCMKIKRKSNRKVNQILAITRSMTRQSNEQNKIAMPVDIDSNVKITEDLSFNKRKNVPRIRTLNVDFSRNGNLISIALSAFLKHKNVFSINLNDESVNIKMILSNLEKQMRARNMKSIEWPLHDCIFNLCSVEDFKTACNQFLNEIEIFLIKTPKRVDSSDEQESILKKFHCDELYGAHSGQKKMNAKIRSHFYWRNLSKDIAKFINNCQRCKLAKPTIKNQEQLVETYTPQKPFDLVQIDTIGPLQESKFGNKYAVTIQCELTKYLVTIPTRGKTAAEVAKGIFEQFILIFGPMKGIKTDRGKEYENELMKDLCTLLKVEQATSTAYHHQTLGVVERGHRTFNEYMRIYLEGMLDDWDTYAKYFTFAYNINKNSSNGEKYSPYELVFAKNITFPHEILNGRIDPVYNIDNYVKEAKLKLQHAHEQARQTIDKIKKRTKEYYDRTSNPINVKIGDIVKIVSETNNKFLDRYKGPYKVIALDDTNVIIQLDNKEYKIHKDRIRKY
ncbi:MAG: hypothetical protein EOP45_04435 [Sphingobacteriaceae bacterium]|nr:MAG: hypothetical protein EOP45_04435 [Sphingobacteriaceae bacterium]